MNAFLARKSHKLETPEYGMHATARNYALKYCVRLGRFGEGHGVRTGYYYIAGRPEFLSMQPTAKSAIAMMRRAGYR